MSAHPVDEKLPALRMATTGLQHVAAMYAGVVAPPLIVGAAIGLTGADLTFLTGACLFTAGLATLLQTLGIWRIGVSQLLETITTAAAWARACAVPSRRAEAAEHRIRLVRRVRGGWAGARDYARGRFGPMP